MHCARILALVCALAPAARGGRPLVTDDARVVGKGSAQLESWLFVDSQSLVWSNLLGVGPTPWLELSVGGALGEGSAAGARGFGVNVPVLQAKVRLFGQAGWRPAFALVLGASLPGGTGTLRLAGPQAFGYLATTHELLDGHLAVLVNLGAAFARDAMWTGTLTAGAGLEVPLNGRLSLVGEVWSGDPYAAEARSAALEVGFRLTPLEALQFDGTLGRSLRGRSDAAQFWATLGVRFATALW